MTDPDTTIRVRMSVRDRLNRYGKKGETFDDVITRLLDKVEGKLA